MAQEDLAQPVHVAEFARACRLSASQFSRAFRQSVGESPHRWRLGLRIDRAKTLLEGGELPLAEIAIDCGFSDQSHFNRMFAQITGVTPGRWRKAFDTASRAEVTSRRDRQCLLARAG